MKKLIFIFFCCFQINAQTVQQSLYDNYKIKIVEVDYSLYGLKFKTKVNPQEKKAIENTFKNDFSNTYKELKTYKLRVYKKQNYIYVDDIKSLEIKAIKKLLY